MDLVPQARRALLTAYADTTRRSRRSTSSTSTTTCSSRGSRRRRSSTRSSTTCSRAGSATGGRRSTRPRSSGTPGRRSRTRSATSWPATSCPTAGTTSRTRTASGCWPRRARDRPTCRSWSPPSGEALSRPSLTELATAVGLDTTPRGDFYDVVIVGGGPAGLGAAVYAASEGLKTVVVERSAAGGQAGQSSRIENYLGFPDGVSGAQLTDRARRQAVRLGAELLTARSVVGLKAKGPAREITFDDGETAAGPRRGAGDRGLLPPARRRGRGRAARARHLLRLGVDRGGRLRRPARHHRRRGQLRGPGGGVLLHARRPGDARRARRLAERSRCRAISSSRSQALDNIDVRTCTQVEKVEGEEHLSA